MDYYIIQKLEYIDNQLIYSNIGYFTHSHYVEYFYENYEKNFIDFIEENKSALESGTMSISGYFDIYPDTYVSDIIVDNIEGYDLPLINVEI